MNREERERTKAGWRRPKAKLLDGPKPGDKLRVLSTNSTMYGWGIRQAQIVTFKCFIDHGNEQRYQIEELAVHHALFPWRFERV